jgi:hypothetical protein
MMNKRLADLTHMLRAPLALADVFNPWRDVDQENEIDEDGPDIRSLQLTHYLESRLDHAAFLLIGEALGYQGGHFSGIAMTSERILLGHQQGRGIFPRHVLPKIRPRRTSKPAIQPKGFTEPTATIVWQKLMSLSNAPLQFVLWNAFPWHPFQPEKGLLSNRRPRRSELKQSLPVLKALLGLFPRTKVIGVGNVAAEQLAALQTPFQPVRHPAQGGARLFRQQMSQLFEAS